MRIAVLGTGIVGRTLAGKLDELGHDVVVGTRDPDKTMASADTDYVGNPPYSTWAGEHPGVRLATFADAASAADLVVNATSGSVSLDVLTQAGEPNLSGKVVVDVSNPLDFAKGFPPTLFVKDDDSLAEQIQRAFPDARVVKTLNTMTAAVMVAPASPGEQGTVFVSGDDTGAKGEVAELLHSMGHEDVVDLGDLTTARGAEMILPLWLRVMGSLGNPIFNFKVVR
jgi:predicted dinucleotide-binding enzyme